MITEQDRNKVLEERRAKKAAREQAEKERAEHLAEVNDPDVWVQVIAKHRSEHPVSYTVTFDEPECSIQTGSRYTIFHTEPTPKAMAFETVARIVSFAVIGLMCYLSYRLGVGPV